MTYSVSGVRTSMDNSYQTAHNFTSNVYSGHVYNTQYIHLNPVHVLEVLITSQCFLESTPRCLARTRSWRHSIEYA